LRVRDYTLKVRLGAGGMGEVWLATDEGPHGFRKNVVLKTMLPEAARFLDYFTSEARLGAKLHHQNVVNVIDFFVDGGRHYLVLEYVEGIDLLALIEKARLTPEQSVYVACQALRGLHYAHEAVLDGRPARIVHRDISPDNILVSLGAEVKVSDFGIAKAEVAWREKTTGNPFKGKWGYVSPEMLLGQDVDARADIYQMGVVLYEMLTGGRAFPGGSSTYHLAAVIVEGKVPPLGQVAPELPNSLVSVVECMMHPEREQRMPTAEAARTALMKAMPEHVHAERSLGELVRRATAKGRRPTSPFLRPGEGVVAAPAAPAVVMAAAPLDETVRVAPSEISPAPSGGVPSSVIEDESHELRLGPADEEREPLHVVRRKLRASRVKMAPVAAGTPTVKTPTQAPARTQTRARAILVAIGLVLLGAAAAHFWGVWP
jgi:serine/threonine protein kinase